MSAVVLWLTRSPVSRGTMTSRNARGMCWSRLVITSLNEGCNNPNDLWVSECPAQFLGDDCVVLISTNMVELATSPSFS